MAEDGQSELPGRAPTAVVDGAADNNGTDDCTGRPYAHPIGLIALVLGAMLLIGLRLHAFALPLETDECNYLYIAQRLVAGDRLYTDIWDHQPPGVFAMFSLIIGVYGSSEAVMRWTAIAASLVTMGGLYVVGGRSQMLGGVFAAMLFAVASSDPGTAGEGCNREIYMNALTVLGLAILVMGRRTLVAIGIAGAVIGVASLFKTVVAAQWLFVAIWLVVSGRRNTARGDRVRRLLAFGVGPAVLWSAVYFYFAATGRGQEFVDAVFRYNVGYSEINGSLMSRFADFFTPVFNVFTSALPLWLLSPVAVVVILFVYRERLHTTTGLMLAYVVGSFLAVCLPGRFWPHYYYLLMPAMIMIIAECVGIVREKSGSLRISLGIAVTIIVFAAGFQYVHYVSVSPDEITSPHPVYRYRQAWARGQAQRMQQVTDPDDTIFVWGQDAGMYYYSHRRSASRYSMVGALLVDTDAARQRRRILLAEIDANRPRLVIIIEPEFPELAEFLQQRYILAGRNAFDHHDLKPNETIMLVLMDPSNPIEPINWEWPP